MEEENRPPTDPRNWYLIEWIGRATGDDPNQKYALLPVDAVAGPIENRDPERIKVNDQIMFNREDDTDEGPCNARVCDISTQRERLSRKLTDWIENGRPDSCSGDSNHTNESKDRGYAAASEHEQEDLDEGDEGSRPIPPYLLDTIDLQDDSPMPVPDPELAGPSNPGSSILKRRLLLPKKGTKRPRTTSSSESTSTSSAEQQQDSGSEQAEPTCMRVNPVMLPLSNSGIEEVLDRLHNVAPVDNEASASNEASTSNETSAHNERPLGNRVAVDNGGLTGSDESPIDDDDPPRDDDDIMNESPYGTDFTEDEACPNGNHSDSASSRRNMRLSSD